ncbi:MAG: DUF2304 domain-containing protein [Demequinaceae bacterium]|nr:DUF2304 domain-containing protein [Demequinaceae bacterium]
MSAAYILGIVAPLLILATVVDLLRRGKMRERHAVWWMVFGVLALVGGIFPALLERLASLTGVELPVNLVFFVAISVAFLVFLQHSSELTKLEAKTRTLAERLSLLELELRRLRGENPTATETADGPPGTMAPPAGDA